MRSRDKLIRQKCPACGVEFALSVSTLNKKIHCPKCRQVVIIPADAPPPAKPPVVAVAAQISAPAPVPAAIPPTPEPAATGLETKVETEDSVIAAREEFPKNGGVGALPVLRAYRAEESIPSEPHEHEPVIYCLCKGVLKKRIVSAEWGPSRDICCMCLKEAEAEAKVQAEARS